MKENKAQMPLSVGAFLKGVGVKNVELDENNHLLIYLDNGEKVDAGEFKVDTALDINSSRPVANKILSRTLNEYKQTHSNLYSQIQALKSGDGSGNLNGVDAIAAFLQGVSDKTTLLNMIEEINTSIAAEVSTITETLGDKVDKEDGKGLSTNDYTHYDKLLMERVDRMWGVISGAVTASSPSVIRDKSYTSL
jgi:hypothetical protein